MKEILDNLFRILKPTDSDGGASKAVNILYFVVAACWAVVQFSCKIGLQVPGVTCG